MLDAFSAGGRALYEGRRAKSHNARGKVVGKEGERERKGRGKGSGRGRGNSRHAYNYIWNMFKQLVLANN